MSRTPQQPAEIHVEPGPLPDAHAITLLETKVVNAIEQNHSEERDLVNQLWGQIQMASAVQKLTTVVSLTKLAHIKETKLYRALSGKKGVDAHGEEIADVGTWEGFCRAIGSSKTKVDEDLLNLRAFGEDALESLSRIGAGVREMRQYRRLPVEERAALIEAAKAGDKDELLDLAETLIARHVQEKATLEARAIEAEETAEARSEVIAKKESMINALQESNSKLKRRQSTFTDEEACAYECAPLHDAINESMVALLKMATEVKRLVEEVGGELVTEECFHAVLLPIKRALEIAAHNGLHIDLATLFDEQIDASVEALQARAAGLTGALQ